MFAPKNTEYDCVSAASADCCGVKQPETTATPSLRLVLSWIG